MLETPDGVRDDKLSLGRGDYRLYLLGDGDQLQVTLRLDGLSGRSVVHPTAPVRVDIKSPEVRVDVEPAGSQIFSAGNTYSGSGLGLGLAV